MTQRSRRADKIILYCKVPTFEYAATLCILRSSRHYYDCVWKSHVKVAGPANIHAQETLLTEECLTTSLARVYFDPSSGVQHTLTPSVEVNYLQSMVEGSITYYGTDSHYSGTESMVEGERVARLLTTIIRENGVSIPAPYKQNGVMNTDFGTLVFHRGQPPC